VKSILGFLTRRRADPASGARPTRYERWLRIRRGLAIGLAVFGAVLLLTVPYAVYVEPYWIRYHDVDVRIAGLPDEFEGFTIAHVTDIHCSEIFPPERVRKVLDRVRERGPDVVAVTGDLVQKRDTYEGVFGEIDRIARDVPTYVVPGNHDYWQGIERYHELIGATAATDLTNAHRVMERGGKRLVITGVDDLTDGKPDLEKALAGLAAPSPPVVLLMHNPNFFPKVFASAARVDLVLAGHSHGGQVSIPLLGPPVVPVAKREYTTGLVREGDTQMYVSRGVGMLVKLRLNCRPEVAFVVLHGE
jgi:predicted MPP superfamily phosphohydrolase